MLQVQDKRKELLAGEMVDYYIAEPKVLQADAKAVAVKEWKLLDEEHRSAYQERAAGTRLIHVLQPLPLQACKKFAYNTTQPYAYCCIASSCLPHVKTCIATKMNCSQCDTLHLIPLPRDGHWVSCLEATCLLFLSPKPTARCCIQA